MSSPSSFLDTKQDDTLQPFVNHIQPGSSSPQSHQLFTSQAAVTTPYYSFDIKKEEQRRFSYADLLSSEHTAAPDYEPYMPLSSTASPSNESADEYQTSQSQMSSRSSSTAGNEGTAMDLSSFTSTAAGFNLGSVCFDNNLVPGTAATTTGMFSSAIHPLSMAAPLMPQRSVLQHRHSIAAPFSVPTFFDNTVQRHNSFSHTGFLDPTMQGYLCTTRPFGNKDLNQSFNVYPSPPQQQQEGRSRQKSQDKTLKAPRSRGRRVSNVPSNGARMFTCTHDGCGKVFKRSEHLKRHIRSIHTLEKRT